MGKDSAIEWCNHTFNAWHGCQKVSPGCEHCYAETLSNRFGNNIWGPAKTTNRRLFGEKHWREPLKWDAQAKKDGTRARVFSGSMCDVFEDHPQVREERGRLINLITNTPHLQWLLLTKRPENIMWMLEDALLTAGFLLDDAESWLSSMGDRVWIGTSVEDQRRADERIPHLLKVPAAVRFLSCEPLLGPIDLWGARYENPDGSRTGAISTWAKHGVNWVIVGGESGPHARPMKAQWARDIVRDCKAAGVPVFFKQWGEWIEGVGNGANERMAGGSHIEFGSYKVSMEGFKEQGSHYRVMDGSYFWRQGKKDAGRELDGVEYSEFPG